MAFSDKNLNGGPIGRSVTGLIITKTAAMTLEVASGSVTHQQTGTTYTLAGAENHVFTSDPGSVKRVFMAIIDNGVSTDLWVDEYIVDGINTRGDVPAGYAVVHALAWFDIAAAETDLVNSTINRRILL